MIISQFKVGGVWTWFWYQIRAECVPLTMIPKKKNDFTQNVTCSLFCMFCGSASQLLVLSSNIISILWDWSVWWKVILACNLKRHWLSITSVPNFFQKYCIFKTSCTIEVFASVMTAYWFLPFHLKAYSQISYRWCSFFDFVPNPKLLLLCTWNFCVCYKSTFFP